MPPPPSYAYDFSKPNQPMQVSLTQSTLAISYLSIGNHTSKLSNIVEAYSDHGIINIHGLLFVPVGIKYIAGCM